MFSKNSDLSGRTLHAFSIYDSKGETFSPPFFMQAKGEAIRAFTETASDRQTTIGKYPADFTLFQIGTFNPDDGKLEALRTPLSLGLAIEFQPQQQQIPPQAELLRERFNGEC